MHLVVIFVSDTYMAIGCEIDVAVSFDLVYMCITVGSIYGVYSMILNVAVKVFVRCTWLYFLRGITDFTC